MITFYRSEGRQDFLKMRTAMSISKSFLVLLFVSRCRNGYVPGVLSISVLTGSLPRPLLATKPWNINSSGAGAESSPSCMAGRFSKQFENSTDFLHLLGRCIMRPSRFICQPRISCRLYFQEALPFDSQSGKVRKKFCILVDLS